jgi:hypothetical protein
MRNSSPPPLFLLISGTAMVYKLDHRENVILAEYNLKLRVLHQMSIGKSAYFLMGKHLIQVCGSVPHEIAVHKIITLPL